MEDYIYPSDRIPEYSSILVPNIDNVCISFLIETIAKQNKAVLLIGEQGTAKTVMLKSYMSAYDNEYKLFKVINFSSASTPNMFQVSLLKTENWILYLGLIEFSLQMLVYLILVYFNLLYRYWNLCCF